ncbi:hypothetical protein D9M71_453540 [compost metagenome]
MAEHGAGVAETEVDVLVAVDIVEARPLGAFDEQRAGRRPVGHPVHRYAGVEGLVRTLGEGDGFRIAFQEALPLAGAEGFDGLLGDTAGGHFAHLVCFFAHHPFVITKKSIQVERRLLICRYRFFVITKVRK